MDINNIGTRFTTCADKSFKTKAAAKLPFII